MAVAVRGGRHLILFLEEFDEMRGVGESAFVADFRDGFRRGDEQQTRVHEPLANVPLVRRHLEMAAEFLLERCQRTVGELRELFDRDVLEDMVVNDLLEVLLGGIDVAEQLALDAAILVRGEQVDQFGHLDVLGRLVVAEVLVAQIVVGVDEKVAQRVPGGHRDVRTVAAVFARMFVRNVQSVGDVQVHEDALQVGRRVIKEHLLERLASFGEVLDVVVSDAQVKHVAARKCLALIAVIDVLRAAEDVPDGITRKDLRLDSVVKRLYVLHDHRLLYR